MPLSPEAAAWRSGPSWTAGSSPQSATAAAGPLLRREVHFALENDGWNCIFECEVHVSASFGVRKVIPGTSGDVESFSSGSGRGEAGGESAFCGRFADPRPVILPRARRFGDGLAGPGDGRGPRDRFGRSGPGWVTGSFADRCSRGPSGVVEVVTAIVGAPAAPAARPADALPDRPTPADCPNLPQRPRPSRSAREETLIFRASAHSRHRPRAPLWQIWTRPALGRHRNPTSTTPTPTHPSHHAGPDPRTTVPSEKGSLSRTGPRAHPPHPFPPAPPRRSLALGRRFW